MPVAGQLVLRNNGFELLQQRKRDEETTFDLKLANKDVLYSEQVIGEIYAWWNEHCNFWSGFVLFLNLK